MVIYVSWDLGDYFPGIIQHISSFHQSLRPTVAYDNYYLHEGKHLCKKKEDF
jgi:hypothetical protein